MRRTTNSGGRDASEARGRARNGQLDRARIEARLGFRPSIEDETPEHQQGRHGLTLRDGAIAFAVCVAASGPAIAPMLDHETRVALSWQDHLDATGAIETATIPLSIPAGITAGISDAVRAERAATPFWAEAKMDRAAPARPVEMAEAPEPLEIEVGGAIVPTPPDEDVASLPPNPLGEIVTGVVLDGPMAEGHAVAETELPFTLDGPIAFPTATIGGDEQPFPGLKPTPAQPMPVFRPGENPFEMNRSRKEELGILDTGAVPARRARTAPPADAMAPPPHSSTRSAPLSLALATLGGGYMVEEAVRAIDAVDASIQSGAMDALLAEFGFEQGPDFTPLDAAEANAEAAADSSAITAMDAIAATPNPHPALSTRIITRTASDSSSKPKARRDVDSTIAVAIEPFQSETIGDGTIETASIRDMTYQDLGNDQALRFAPRPVRDPRTAIALRAERMAGVAPEASPAAQPRPVEVAAAAPFVSAPAPRPKVTIVLTAVGLNSDASKAAMTELPSEVALSIAPIAADSVAWTTRAHETGRVVLAETPMEPESYPRVNPGPLTLLVKNSVEENVRRLGETLARVPGAHGVATYLGGRFAKNDTAAVMFSTALGRRGLMMLETVSERGRILSKTAAKAGVPVFEAAVSVDSSGHDRDIAAGLRRLEEAARRDGYAIGVGVTIPSTVAGIDLWLDTLEDKGIDLVALGPVGKPEPAAAVAAFADQ